MSTAPQKRTANFATSEALERVRVLWLISFLLLLVILVMITVFLSGYVRRLADTLSTQSGVIDSLSQELKDAGDKLRDLEARIAGLQATARSTLPARQPPTAAPQESAPPELTSADVRSAARSLRQLDAEGQSTLRDPRAALALLEETRAAAADGRFTGETLEDLAILAVLLNDDVRAAELELQSTRAGWMPIRLYEASTRRLLAQGKLLEARAAAKRLVSAADAPPAAPVLLVAVEYALGRHAFADDALAQVPDPAALSIPDRLRLAHVLVGLERWVDARRTVDGLGPLPEAQQRVLNLVRAILAIQDGQNAVGLGILDHLLADAPRDYDLLTWRGIALLRAGQYQAAREALAVAQRDAARPEAWYWLGVLEDADGDTDAAQAALQRAISADDKFAPALEALGNVALQRDRLTDAVSYLARAIEADARRASSHFLLAIAQARASNRLEAEAALRTALQLDPTLVENAQRVAAIQALFSAEDLRGMANAQNDSPRVD